LHKEATAPGIEGKEMMAEQTEKTTVTKADIELAKLAERELLGSLLVGGADGDIEPLKAARVLVNDTDFLDHSFHDNIHTRIYKAMLETGRTDQLTVAEKLNDMNLLRLKDITYMSVLISESPGFDCAYYAGRVADLASKRRNGRQPETEIPGWVNLSDVIPEVVQWLWYPYIPRGKLTLLEGDPGIGKSWVTLAIATAISRGSMLPGQNETLAGPVLIATAEDGLADTVRPRCEKMGADLTSINVVKELMTLDQAGFDMLETYIFETTPGLLIIDPLVAYFSGDMDINRANAVRWGTSRLAKIAEKYSLAALAVRHLTKGGSLKPIYRGLGSIDFTASARSVLLAGCDSEDEHNRGIVHIKSNLARMGEAVGYELGEEGFFWTAHSDLTAGRILAGREDNETPGKSAELFLMDFLSGGGVRSAEVLEAAEAQGINEKTLRRIKDKLRIVVFREGKKGERGMGAWWWRLPD